MEFKTREALEKISVELDYLEAVIDMAWLWAVKSEEKTMSKVLSAASTKLEWLAEELNQMTAEQEVTA